VRLTDSAVILVDILRSLSGEEADLGDDVVASGHPSPDGGLGALGKRFAVNVLRDQPWDVTVIAWNVLLAHLMLVAADPGGGVSAAVTKHVLEWFVFWCHTLQRYVAVQAHSR
jgi:hypothetical protein